jgi:hypothetical protein
MQTVHALRVKHALYFRGRSGQQDHQLAMLTVNRVQPLSGRRAPGVFEHHGPIQHIGLAGVVVRHLDSAGGEAGIEGADDFGITTQANAQRFRHCLTRQIVFRGTESAHGDDDVGASQCDTNRVGEMR